MLLRYTAQVGNFHQPFEGHPRDFCTVSWFYSVQLLYRNRQYWQWCRKASSSSRAGKKYQQQGGNKRELKDKGGSEKGEEEITISY